MNDDELMTRAMFGQYAVRVPMWMVVQDCAGGKVSFIGATQDQRLRYGATEIHQLILGELIVRPHIIVASNKYAGTGMSGLLKQNHTLEEWLADGRVVCDPAGKQRPLSAGR